MKMDPKEIDLILKQRENLWKYFSQHADQRLKAFNFYLIMSSLFIGGYARLLLSDKEIPAFAIIPLLLSIISYIFWKLDHRTKLMIKRSEESIIVFDRIIAEELPDVISDAEKIKVNIIAYDEAEKSKNRREASYSKCFSFVYLIIGVLGLICAWVTLVNGIDLTFYKLFL
jgi:hypothetical protein